MLGKKEYQEKLFLSFQLSERVPSENFYRRLKEVLDLRFLYDSVSGYYGDCGQQSLDPIVFFKMSLVGYLENILSDRQLVTHCSMRLDILYFLDYDLDEPLPWHSTISRTRQLYPETVYEELFSNVLSLCISKGMVSGRTQCIDSAPVKANASMDSLELKVPERDLEDYLHQIRHISKMDKKPKEDKASQEEKTITANAQELQSIKSRNKRWSEDQDQRPGAGRKNSKYTSNKTHYSPTDPDARISVKPGKARKLNYLSQLSVDTSHHVITDIQAYHADGKDNQQLQDITLRLKQRLWRAGLQIENLLADTGYSSGENYAFLEDQGIKSYIPPHGTYKGGPEGFIYNEQTDSFTCPQGKTIPYVKHYNCSRTETLKKEYRARKSVCVGCPLKQSCLKNSAEKRISLTAYREEYERNNARVKSPQGQRFKKQRSSTVEPVFGVLTQYLGMRKVNTKGLSQANKVMHMAAIAYNLKKYLKTLHKTVKSGAKAAHLLFQNNNALFILYKRHLSHSFFTPLNP